MQYELQDLLDRAQTVWRSRAALRLIDAQQVTVRFSRHPIPIPETMTGRAEPIYSHKGAEKVDRSKSILGSTRGLRVRVAANGDSAQALTDKARMQKILFGVLRANEKRSGETLSDFLKEDHLLLSRGWLKALPLPSVWTACPEVDEPAYDDEDEETDDSKRRRSTQRKRQELHQRGHCPILVEHVPGEGVIEETDHQGLACVWEYQEWPILRVLRTFKDEDGNPLAKKLEDSVSARERRGYDLTEEDVCTLIIYADREHMQIVVGDFPLDNQGIAYRSAVHHGDGELLWQGEHGLSRVPYVKFRGRELPARRPEDRYWGLLRPVASMICSLDKAITQRASSARMIAWPGMVVEKHWDAPADVGGGDRPESFTLDEGGVSLALMPGEKITSPAWTNSESYQILQQNIDFLLSQIDLHTLSGASYGIGNAPSGYLNAQEQAASEHVLEPWEIGLNHGWAELCELVVECARYLFRECEFPPIPVLYADSEGSETVVLDEALAEQDWDITVDIQARPTGGEMAQLQAHALKKQNGWASDRELMEEQGNPDPMRTMAWQLQERVVNGAKFLQMIEAATEARYLTALAAAVTPTMPNQPIISSTLAGMLQSPTAQALLPDGLASTLPGNQPLGGVMNSSVPPAPLGPPTPRPGIEGAALAGGGMPVGAGMAAPGGMNRQSDLLSRQR